MFKQFIRFGEFKGYKYLLNKDQGLKYLNEFAAYTRELAKDAKTINEFRLENFKVTAGFANAAIKALLIGNGGALVALSAFRQKLSVQEFTSMLPSVPWFMLGTIAAILLPLVEYIGQSKKRIDTELEIFPGEECGKTYNYLSRFIAFISLVAFGVGLLNLYCAMK